MPYFKICPYCGSHLDPGEACNCLDEDTTKETKKGGETYENHFERTGRGLSGYKYRPVRVGRR